MTPFAFNSAVRSNVGLVRKNNQDSGYAGPNFLLIADGMGGHAGGDVASAITVSRLAELDCEDHSADALEHLRSSVLDANERILNAVSEKPELAGMGTTVTAVLRAGDRLALAHIGDSRGYLLRDETLTQLTSDHTFVQMLVDSGRITEEEAEYHPQRSVVMRVLGDVGASPELDLSIREARIGDRWMLCSDGLTGFASREAIEEALTTISDPAECADALVNLAIEGGGADNITVVVGDVVEATEELSNKDGETAGSIAINPQFALFGQRDVPTVRLDELDLDTVADDTYGNFSDSESLNDTTAEVPAAAAAGTSAAGDTSRAAPEASEPTTSQAASGAAAMAEAGPDSEEPTSAEEELDAVDDDFDDRPRRPWVKAVVTAVVVLLIAAAGLLGWRFIQSQYYVTEVNGNVAVYQGISQDLGPLKLSHLAEETDIPTSALTSYSQTRLSETIPAPSKESADQVVQSLRDEAQRNSNSDAVTGAATDAAPNNPAPTGDATLNPQQGSDPQGAGQQGQTQQSGGAAGEQANSGGSVDRAAAADADGGADTGSAQ